MSRELGALTILLACLAGACAATPTARLPATVTAQATLPAPSPVPTQSPTAASTQSSPEPESAPTPIPQLCSPLDGVSLERLTEAIANPFLPPKPGSDAPHQGVDLAELRGDNQLAVGGLPIRSVMEGRVAATIQDRFPYGNAVLVETPLDELPGDWLLQLALPSPGSPWVADPALTCPEMPTGPDRDPVSRSLYLLYGHMESPPVFEPGDQVGCGDRLGAIGASGNALNPHLHLEVRVGPSGARFASMAHYDASATPEEMANYCLWRVGGMFQLVDPLRLLSLSP